MSSSHPSCGENGTGLGHQFLKTIGKVIQTFDYVKQIFQEPIRNIYGRAKSGADICKEIIVKGSEIILSLGIGSFVVFTQFFLTVVLNLTSFSINRIIDCENVLRTFTTTCESVKEKTKGYIHSGLLFLGKLIGCDFENDSVVKAVEKRMKMVSVNLSSTISSIGHFEACEPVIREVYNLYQNLWNSLTLADSIRNGSNWAVEKINHIKEPVKNMKNRLEEEAERLQKKPEEILLHTIRQNSHKLTDRLGALRESYNQAFGDIFSQKLDAALAYIAHLNEGLQNAESINDIRDEVLHESFDKINDFLQFLRSIFTFAIKDEIHADKND